MGEMVILGVTPGVWQVVLFLILSAGLAHVSRAALRRPGAHGFWRFFAWEAILGLFLLNVEHWFDDPFSLRQMISWSFLVVSGFLVLHAVYILHRYGRPVEQRGDEALIAFEKTSQLVTQGLYAYIRHPMYSSLLFLAWGIFCKAPGWVGGVLAAATTCLLVATARADEAECTRFFGSVYLDYKKHTRMFIPGLF